MSLIDEKIQNFISIVKESRDLIDIEKMREEFNDLQQRMNDSDFWNNQNSAREISQRAADLGTEIKKWDDLLNGLNDLLDVLALAEEENDSDVLKEVEETFEHFSKEYHSLELSTLLSNEYDQNNAIISIHAGAGGTDAQDWAEMVARMLMKFSESRDWSISIIDQSLGEEAGIKSMTFSVQGRNAFGYLKTEAGVHRLVRISPFDAEGMRHTSFALVEVIPELDDVSASNIEIDPSDLRVDTYASSGAGGQSVNTTNSAVRVTHLPTNTVVTCQNERSQQQNKETAMKVLKARLFKRLQEERKEKLDELKGGHISAEWGSQIRSYVLHPYKLVKDHRTKAESNDTDGVLSGDLILFIESVLRMNVKNESSEK